MKGFWSKSKYYFLQALMQYYYVDYNDHHQHQHQHQQHYHPIYYHTHYFHQLEIIYIHKKGSQDIHFFYLNIIGSYIMFVSMPVSFFVFIFLLIHFDLLLLLFLLLSLLVSRFLSKFFVHSRCSDDTPKSIAFATPVVILTLFSSIFNTPVLVTSELLST